MIASLLLILVSGIPVSLEAVGGLITPGLPYTDSPALFCEFRFGAEVVEDWLVFVGVPFWSLSNFHPTSDPPEFYDDMGYHYMEYNWYEDYSESRLGVQLGVRRPIGNFALELAGGIVNGSAKYKMSGVGKDCYGEEHLERDGEFLGSFNFVIPTGNNGLFSIGTKTEGFSDWYFTAGAGLTFSIEAGDH